MTLLLQIENVDRLADGGPVTMPVTRQICHVGRAAGMDWVLPDPSRMISGHHFDVHFNDGAWWLTDRSTNGTFLLGSPYRLSQPHRLAHQDRFQVGKYIVIALLNAAEQPGAGAPPQSWAPPFNPGSGHGQDFAPAPMPGAESWADEHEDPWAVGAAPPPMDIRQSHTPRPPADFIDEFIPTPHVPPPAAAPAPAWPPVAPHPPAAPPAGLAPPPPAPFPPAPDIGFAGGAGQGEDPAAHLAFGEMPAPVPRPEPALPEVPPPAPPLPVAPVPLVPPVSRPPQPLPPVASGAENGTGLPADFVTAFCAAAGLDSGLAAGLDPATFGRVLGEIMRSTTTELMSQLKLRAAARKFTRSSDQTMRQAQANNPLKFLPGPEQALEAILFRPRAGFLTGAAATGAALEDLRHHHIAVFAALQPALIRLLEDLSPDAVEAASGGKGFLAGARKVRAWESYVQAWDAKTHPHENGMLDAFLALFAEAYHEAQLRQRGEVTD